jgi:hypothetical protein
MPEAIKNSNIVTICYIFNNIIWDKFSSLLLEVFRAVVVGRTGDRPHVPPKHRFYWTARRYGPEYKSSQF